MKFNNAMNDVLQNEFDEMDLATFVIGHDGIIDGKAQVPKIQGMDKETWERILKLSLSER